MTRLKFGCGPGALFWIIAKEPVSDFNLFPSRFNLFAIRFPQNGLMIAVSAIEARIEPGRLGAS